tara:strand:- start:490 stop:1692 length:1203 start_codon:yes stop_codon:yes gene_type:complete
MSKDIFKFLEKQLFDIKEEGLYKQERNIIGPQDSRIDVNYKSVLKSKVVNLCANNYLGLSSNKEVIGASIDATRKYGYGLSSVRFICGTQDIHSNLELKISNFFNTEDTILYAAAFDANGGLFEPLFSAEDAIISDELNHASIIDGIRLCKAKRFRYKHSDINDLENKLKEATDCRFRIIVTDGVFSMDGDIAKLDEIYLLSKKYDSLIMIDECHSAGFIGDNGKGTSEYYNLLGKIDIITGTLGKAFGGAMGGFTTGKKEIIDILRQKSRPYLFSNSLCPSIVGGSIKVFDMLENNNTFKNLLDNNTKYFKRKLSSFGFDIKEGESPIIPIMLYDAKLSQVFSEKLFDLGIYVTGFFYPVVPKDQARIRVQISAAHTREDLDFSLSAFQKVGKALKVID